MSPSRPRSRRATGALVALVAAAVAAVTLDALAPGAGPLVQPLSSFAHTSYAWLWHLSVGCAAAAVLLLALALRHRAVSPAFPALLAVAGLGLAAAGIFNADLWFPWERRPTASGGVHVAAVLLVVIAFAVTMLRRAASLPARVGDGPYRALEVTYLVVLAATLLYVAVMGTIARPPLLIGLCERLLLASALAWCGLLAR